MGVLKGYAKSSKLMQITINYGDETYSFNLNDELIVTEETVNREIKIQSNSYAFISMLHKKLLINKDKAEKEMEKRFSDIFIKYKEKINPVTQRPYDKEYVTHIANANPGYQKRKDDFIEAKHQYETIGTCVKAFEQRAFLIQTLSANIRKEN